MRANRRVGELDFWRSSVNRYILFLAVLLIVSTCRSAPTPNEPTQINIDALKWIGENADPITHLLDEPATCLIDDADAATTRGELLFKSPFILGGQAAKAGLSCAACHRNGRGNPDFMMVGISGSPGTADVTNGFFSKHRADNTFNPVFIPDLANAEGRTRVNRSEPGALENFLSKQLVEEFAGAPPNQAVIADLAAYVRALDDRHCQPGGPKMQTWHDEITVLRSGARHINSSHLASSNSYVDAMRAALGRLHARFPGPSASVVRERLIELSRTLSDYPNARLTQPDLDQLEDILRRHEDDSLYQRAQLIAAFQ